LFRWLAGWTEAGVAALDGRLEEALTSVNRNRAVGRAAGPRDAAIVPLTQSCGLMVAGLTIPGITGELAEWMVRAGYPGYGCMLALAHLRDGDLDQAWATLEPLAAGGFSDVPPDVSWTGTLACAAIVIARRREAEAAAVLARLFEPYADQVAVAAGVPFGSISHVLALMAAVMGQYDRADAAFSVAADRHRRMAAPGFLALTQAEWARVLLERGGPGDADRARSLLDDALTTARQLRQTNLERDVVALLQRGRPAAR
jgi:ATP/maltotriose-dependent transcriptional regulator MalT